MAMLRSIGLACTVLAFGVVCPALAEDLPSSAKKASMEEFKAFADGKPLDVVIYDLGVPVTATLVWSWKDMLITGKALVNNKDKIDVKTKLSFDGGKACSDDNGKPSCHLIYIDGNKFHEVRDDGAVHATSTLKE
jgi:hypothetical protein